MVMQAFIDDSTESGQVLILAGYIAPSEQWALFSKEWRELLSIRPLWPRFKMSEILTTAGDESRERILHHYAVIKKYVHSAVVIAAPLAPFLKVVETLILPEWAENPYYAAWPRYYAAWPRFVGAVLQNSEMIGINEPIDFIFDYQSEAGRIMAGQPAIYEAMQTIHGKKIGNFPIFRNEEELLPLQAADMFAWVMRKKFMTLGTIMGNQHYEFPWGPRMLIPNTLCMQLLEKEYFEMGYGIVGQRFKPVGGDESSGWIEVPQSAFRVKKEPS